MLDTPAIWGVRSRRNSQRFDSGTHVYLPALRLIVGVDKLEGRNEELGSLRKGSGACIHMSDQTDGIGD